MDDGNLGIAHDFRYSTGEQSEAFESDHLIFESLERVTNWNFTEEELIEMTPHCKGGLNLLRMRIEERITY
jgi:hypothetical protein